MKFTEKIRYAYSDLSTRRGWSAGIVGVVVLACTGFLLVVDAVQQRMDEVDRDLERGLPRRMTVECPDVGQTDLSFDADGLDDLRGTPGIQHGQPLIDLGLRVELPDFGGDFVVGESIFPRDPMTAENRLEWGRSIAGPDAREVVLPAAFLRKLGGTLGPAGPTPATLWIEVARTRDGEEERRSLPVDIVGVLRFAPANRIYLPHQTLVELDAWCGGRWSALDQAQECDDVLFDHALAYVAADRRHLLEEDVAHLGVDFEAVRSVRALRGSVPAWYRRGARNGHPFRSAGQEYDVYVKSASADGTPVTIVALHDGDPRLEEVPPDLRPSFGEVVLVGATRASTKIDVDGWELSILGQLRGFPVGGDLLMTLETLAWISFDPLQWSGLGEWAILETQNPRVAARIEEQWPGVMFPEPASTWSLCLFGDEASFRDARRGRQDELILRLERRYQGLEAALVNGFPFSVEVGGAVSPPINGMVQALPDEMFFSLAGDMRSAAAPTVPVVMGRGQTGDLPNLKRIDGRPVRLVGAIDTQQHAILLPASHSKPSWAVQPSTGIVIWGDTRTAAWDVPDAVEMALELGIDMRPIAASGPSVFRGVVSDRWSGPAAIRASEDLTIERKMGLPAILDVEGVQYPMRCLWNGEFGRASSGLARVSSRVEQSAQAVVLNTTDTRCPVSLVASTSVPEGVVEVDWRTLRDLAWGDVDALALLHDHLRTDVRVDDLAIWPLLLAEERREGYEPIPLSEVRPTELLQYRVLDPSHPEGRLDVEALQLVRSARASIQRVIAHDTRGVRIGGLEIELVATNAVDPIRFDVGLLAGAWARSGEHLVLAESVAEELYPGEPVESHVGRVVRIWASNSPGDQRGEIPVELQVAGVVTGDRSFVGERSLEVLRRWDAGQLIYEPVSETLIEPTEARRASGALRAVAYAHSLDDIGMVAARLEALGYIVRHRLEEIETVRSMARRTWLFAGLLVGSLVVSGLLLSWSTTSLHVRARRREIGILCALGTPKGTVLEIQVLQGVLLGGLAFVISVVLAVSFSVPVRAVLRSLESALPEHSPEVPIWAPEMWPMFAASLGISVGCPIVGALLGAWNLTRQPVLRSLRGED